MIIFSELLFLQSPSSLDPDKISLFVEEMFMMLMKASPVVALLIVVGYVLTFMISSAGSENSENDPGQERARRPRSGKKKIPLTAAFSFSSCTYCGRKSKSGNQQCTGCGASC